MNEHYDVIIIGNGAGGGTWTRDNERIQNEDVVVWYTLGVTHVARPEEFPVMPAAHASVRLVPKGFFVKNPALDVPDSTVSAAQPSGY
jgi:primary-amine oxidase